MMANLVEGTNFLSEVQQLILCLHTQSKILFLCPLYIISSSKHAAIHENCDYFHVTKLWRCWYWYEKTIMLDRQTGQLSFRWTFWLVRAIEEYLYKYNDNLWSKANISYLPEPVRIQKKRKKNLYLKKLTVV